MGSLERVRRKVNQLSTSWNVYNYTQYLFIYCYQVSKIYGVISEGQ